MGSVPLGAGRSCAADRRRIEADQLAVAIQCANGARGFVHHDLGDLGLRRLLGDVRHHDLGAGGVERRLRIELGQERLINVEFLREQLARVSEVERLQLRLFFQCLWDGRVERALHVRWLDFILDQRRVAGCSGQAVPGFGVEGAARLDSVGALKRGDRLLIIRPALAVDLARREAGTIEQYFSLYQRGRAGSGRASFARRRRQLGCIDRLRIECGGGARLGARPGVRRIRRDQERASADKNHSNRHAVPPRNGAQAAHAPAPHRANPVPGAWGGTTEGVIKHCHRQLLVWSRRISLAQLHDDGVGPAGNVAGSPPSVMNRRRLISNSSLAPPPTRPPHGARHQLNGKLL